MDKAIDILNEQVKQLNKRVSWVAFLAGASLTACYFLNRKIKALNNQIKGLREKE